MKVSSFLLLLFSLNLFAQYPFVVGTGSKFHLSMKDSPTAELAIYIAESSDQNIAVEYFFHAMNTFVETKMWQQFHMKMGSNGAIDIHKGYVKTTSVDHPEILPKGFFAQKDGVQLNDFLFAKEEILNKFKVGDEKIEVPAGSVTASHYRKTNNGQTIDFWISNEAKPIGLVKLVSVHPKKAINNYSIELIGLMKNVKATINPKLAKPISKETQATLSHPLK
jgi:hypothetical protein